MFKQRFKIIGLTEDSFSENEDIIRDEIEKVVIGTVFSGGKRHYDIVKGILPDKHRWIEIGRSIENTLNQYAAEKNILIFASGDPLFFGIGETIIREFPEAEVEIKPYLNSLQLLASKIMLPYGKMKTVSLTGRSWGDFDSSLIRGEDMIGILTDRKKTPRTIAERMMAYGYDNYRFNIGENLGSKEEKIYKGLNINDVISHDYVSPNCLIIEKIQKRAIHFGIPDNDFSILEGRPNMITKMPARLLDIALLELGNKHTLWDIGFCTGSISIEAKLRFPHLQIIAFEKRKECEKLMLENVKKFRTPGIETVIGDFLEIDLSQYPVPDAIFLGGYGGDLNKMISTIRSVIKSETTIVFNSVSEKSRSEFIKYSNENGMKVTAEYHLTVDNHNPLTILQVKWEC
ncbi:MAG: precorrin-6y C5,15-methyltransferase (decarboxylating) subunit CbiE [Paramuribaculum sp.]|nr:precorrin-6y C5,15-methyltransferase (decarboxylating) subunit CbiE [Paramuribaculum sp.]